MRRRLVLALPWVLLTACQPAPVAFRNTDLTGAGFGRHLELSDHHGQARSLADFRGKAIIVFFGYTTCPDICPTTLARLAAVMQALGDQAGRVQVLFVTLDPDRDSQERLQNYVPWFHPSFLGLRGDVGQTDAVAKEFRVFSARKEVGGQLGYVLDHSSGGYIYDTAGRLRIYVKDTASVEDIVVDIRQLLGLGS